MIQKPADRDSEQHLKLALVQTPLKALLEKLQADVDSLTERVGKMQGLVGMGGGAAASLQAIHTRVGQYNGHGRQTGEPHKPAALKGYEPIDDNAPTSNLGLAESQTQVQGAAVAGGANQAAARGNLAVGDGEAKIDDLLAQINPQKPALIETNADDDNTLKAIVEDLEVKVESLKSNVLDLENMVLGTSKMVPIPVKPPSANETTSSLASRANVLDLEVASLRTRVASLEQAVTGEQQAHEAGAAAAA